MRLEIFWKLSLSLSLSLAYCLKLRDGGYFQITLLDKFEIALVTFTYYFTQQYAFYLQDLLGQFLNPATCIVVSVTVSTTQGQPLELNELNAVMEACDLADKLYAVSQSFSRVDFISEFLRRFFLRDREILEFANQIERRREKTRFLKGIDHFFRTAARCSSWSRCEWAWSPPIWLPFWVRGPRLCSSLRLEASPLSRRCLLATYRLVFPF